MVQPRPCEVWTSTLSNNFSTRCCARRWSCPRRATKSRTNIFSTNGSTDPSRLDPYPGCASPLLDSKTLTETLVGGLTKREMLEWDRRLPHRFTSTRSGRQLPALAADQPPVRNTRDTSCWIYDGVAINAMAQRRLAYSSRCTTRRSTGGTRCSPTRTSQVVGGDHGVARPRWMAAMP